MTGGAALLRPLSLSSATVAFTGRAEGDMGHGGGPVVAVRPDVEARRRAVVDLPWTWLRQVHGAEVVRVAGPGDAAGATADAAVTAAPGCALAVLTADCAPVALASAEGVIGVAHAGWRGVAAGVLEATVAEMRDAGRHRHRRGDRALHPPGLLRVRRRRPRRRGRPPRRPRPGHHRRRRAGARPSGGRARPPWRAPASTAVDRRRHLHGLLAATTSPGGAPSSSARPRRLAQR